MARKGPDTREVSGATVELLADSPLYQECQKFDIKVLCTDIPGMRAALKAHFEHSGEEKAYSRIDAQWKAWHNKQSYAFRSEVNILTRQHRLENARRIKGEDAIATAKRALCRPHDPFEGFDFTIRKGDIPDGHHLYPTWGKTPLEIAFRELPENIPDISLREHDRIHEMYRKDKSKIPNYPPGYIMVEALRRYHSRNGTINIFYRVMEKESAYQKKRKERADKNARSVLNHLPWSPPSQQLPPDPGVAPILDALARQTHARPQIIRVGQLAIEHP